MHANNITPQRRENDNVGKRENWKDDDADGEAMQSSKRRRHCPEAGSPAPWLPCRPGQPGKVKPRLGAG